MKKIIKYLFLSFILVSIVSTSIVSAEEINNFSLESEDTKVFELSDNSKIEVNADDNNQEDLVNNESNVEEKGDEPTISNSDSLDNLSESNTTSENVENDYDTDNYNKNYSGNYVYDVKGTWGMTYHSSGSAIAAIVIGRINDRFGFIFSRFANTNVCVNEPYEEFVKNNGEAYKFIVTTIKGLELFDKLDNTYPYSFNNFILSEKSEGVTYLDATNSLIEKYNDLMPDKYKYNESTLKSDFNEMYSLDTAILSVYDKSPEKRRNMSFADYRKYFERYIPEIVYNIFEYENSYLFKNDFPEREEFFEAMIERGLYSDIVDYEYKYSRERYNELEEIARENSYNAKDLMKALIDAFNDNETCLRKGFEKPPVPPTIDKPKIEVQDDIEKIPPPPVVDKPIIPIIPSPDTDKPKIEIPPKNDKPKKPRPRKPGKKISPKTGDDMMLLVNSLLLGISIISIRKIKLSKTK